MNQIPIKRAIFSFEVFVFVAPPNLSSLFKSVVSCFAPSMTYVHADSYHVAVGAPSKDCSVISTPGKLARNMEFRLGLT